jgi:hypothetical protein
MTSTIVTCALLATTVLAVVLWLNPRGRDKWTNRADRESPPQ